MWRPLRPRVKRDLRRLQSGETRDIVITTKWEYDEVDRRMRRFEASLELPEPFEEEGDNGLAEVIQIPTRPETAQTFQRELKAVGSDVDPGDRPDIHAKLDRPLSGIRIPNALDSLPKANPRGDIPRDEAEVDLSYLAELLEFVLWLVSEEHVVNEADVFQAVFWQFGLSPYSDEEISAVFAVIFEATKKPERNKDA